MSDSSAPGGRALALGDGDDGRRVVAAVRIQRRWEGYGASRPLVFLKRRAVDYRGLVGDEMWRQQQQQQQQQYQQRYSQWQNFCAVAIQAAWRGHRAREPFRAHRGAPARAADAAALIQARWRGRAQRRKYLCARAGTARMQAAVRAARQRRQYRRQRESTITIQRLFRAHRAGNEGNRPSWGTSVARLIRLYETLNSTSSAPALPPDLPDATRIHPNTPRESIVPDAAGEGVCSLGDELRGVKWDAHVGEGADSPEDELRGSRDGASDTPLSAPARGEAAPAPRRPKRARKKRRRRKKKREAPEDKMRKLSVECVGLLGRMNGVPKYSPEWVLAKMEVGLICEELEYLYTESIAKNLAKKKRV